MKFKCIFAEQGCKEEILYENIEISEQGMLWEEKNAIHKHTINCASLKCINLDKIRDRKFKVVIDSVNGAGSDALPSMIG